MPIISLANICYHKKLYPRDIITRSLHLLIPFTHFSQTLTPFPLAITYLFLVSMSMFLTCLICFLGSTSKRINMVFFFDLFQFGSIQSLSHVQLFATPWTAACQASLSITNSQSFLKLMSFESEMPSNHLIFCCPLLLSPSVFSSIRVFSNESALHIR